MFTRVTGVHCYSMKPLKRIRRWFASALVRPQQQTPARSPAAPPGVTLPSSEFRSLRLELAERGLELSAREFDVLRFRADPSPTGRN